MSCLRLLAPKQLSSAFKSGLLFVYTTPHKVMAADNLSLRT